MKQFSITYLFVVAIGSVLGSLVSVSQLVRYHFALQLLVIFYFFLKVRAARIKLSGFAIFYFIILVQGIVLGVFHSVFGENDAFETLIYTLIYLAGFMALQLGYYFARTENSTGLISGLSKLAIAELMLLIPRVFMIGLGVRSSIGFTFLSPILLSSTKILVPMLWTIFSLVGFLLSGLRSVLVLGILGLVYAILRNGVFNWRMLVFMVMLLAVGTTLFYSEGQSSYLVQAIYRAVEIVRVRMESTIFSQEGFSLDVGGGRVFEAQVALEKFFSKATYLDLVFGRGFGFTFTDTAVAFHHYESAHTHITPVAFYVRNGIPGLLFYISIFIYMIFATARTVLKGPAFEAVITYVAFVWIAASMFAGFLVDPLAWLVIGVALGLKERKE